MKKINLLTIVIAAAAQFAAAGIVTLDMETAVRAHPKAAENDAKLKSTQAEYETERDKLLDGLQEKQGNLAKLLREADDPVLSEKARKDKLDDAKELRLQIVQDEKSTETRVRQLQRQLRELELLLFDGVMDDITAAVRKIAAAENYDMVLDSSAMRTMAPIPIVVYSKDSLDITDRVIKEIGGKKTDEK